MPDLRSGAVGGAAWVAGLPWRLKPGRGRPLSPSDERLRRVVVIKPCCMGDVLMSTPAIAALREALPQAHIAMAVAPWSLRAVENNPRLDSLIDSPAGRQATTTADYMALVRLIRREGFGAALVLDRSPLLNLVPYLAGVPARAGLDSGNRGLALTHPVRCPSNLARHEVQWYLDVVRALGLPAPEERAYLEFYPTEEERAEATNALREAGDEGESEVGYVAIHLGGGVNPGMRLLSKRWHPEGWARIADWLAETYESTVVLLGGPGKEDREAADAVKAALFPATRAYVVDLVGKLGWGELGAMIERCGLFLGNDTGAMHLATAVRTPVVAVFGPSDPARFGPWDPSGRSTVVAPESSGSDAGSLRRAAAGGEAYNSLISPEEVWEAVERVYAGVLARA
ncbi:MAG: glycosyltransferase family 9 protein [Chloroflexia bacterium]